MGVTCNGLLGLSSTACMAGVALHNVAHLPRVVRCLPTRHSPPATCHLLPDACCAPPGTCGSGHMPHVARRLTRAAHAPSESCSQVLGGPSALHLVLLATCHVPRPTSHVPPRLPLGDAAPAAGGAAVRRGTRPEGCGPAAEPAHAGVLASSVRCPEKRDGVVLVQRRCRVMWYVVYHVVLRFLWSHGQWWGHLAGRRTSPCQPQAPMSSAPAHTEKIVLHLVPRGPPV